MPTIFNKDQLEFRESNNPHKNYNLLTSAPRMFQAVESQHLIFDMRMLPAGQYSFPYHFHHNAEEMFVIFSGTATLRTPEGLKTVGAGDIIFFEIGEQGAHQLYNHGTEACVYLDIRTSAGFDVSEYPDSGKINVIPLKQIFMKDTKVDYYTGEEDADTFWENLVR